MNAHVKRQHPDVDIPKGFTRNLPNNGVGVSLVTPTKRKVYILIHKVVTPILLLPKTGKIVRVNIMILSFLINNGIKIEKIKENINLLKSIDNF